MFSSTRFLKCVRSVCYRGVPDSLAGTWRHPDCGEDSWWPEQWAPHSHHPEKDQRHHSQEQRALSNKPSGETHNTRMGSNSRFLARGPWCSKLETFNTKFCSVNGKLTPLVSLWSLKKLFALDPEVFCGINMVLSTATFSCETQQSMTNISLY